MFFRVCLMFGIHICRSVLTLNTGRNFPFFCCCSVVIFLSMFLLLAQVKYTVQHCPPNKSSGTASIRSPKTYQSSHSTSQRVFYREKHFVEYLGRGRGFMWRLLGGWGHVDQISHMTLPQSGPEMLSSWVHVFV